MRPLRSPFARRAASPTQPPKARLRLETCEDRALPSVSVASSFGGMSFASTRVGFPPDTQAAAGPNYVVEAVNTDIAIYTKSGTQVSAQSLQSFFNSFSPRTLSDPIVSYDEDAGRFVVGILDVDTSSGATDPGRIDFAVSNSSDPTQGFSEKHSISVTETAATGPNAGKSLWGDFLRFGRNADAYVFTVNMFTAPISSSSVFDHVQVVAVGKSSVTDSDSSTLSGNRIDRTDLGGTLVPATMHGATTGDPMWFVQEDVQSGGSGLPTGSSLRVIRLDGALGTSPTFTDYVVPVSSYSYTYSGYQMTPPASQKGTIALIETNDSRMLSAAWRDGRLVATQEVGTTDSSGASVARARWYDFSTSGATPSLTQSGQINPVVAGSGSATYFPSIDINGNGDLGMTFMESSSKEYMSMYVTGQKSGDTPGVMQGSVLVQGGATYYRPIGDSSPFRAGDYSALSVDPSTGEFWAANEYATTRSGYSVFANWGTRIGRFTVSSLAKPTANVSLGNGGATGSTSTTTTTPTPAPLTLTGTGGSDGTDHPQPPPQAVWSGLATSAVRSKRPDWVDEMLGVSVV